MPVIKIGTPYSAPGITTNRFGKRDMVIPYTLDGKGPFDIRLPMESFTPETAEAAVKEQAKKQSALQDKQLTI